jgi:hypothetical protein
MVQRGADRFRLVPKSHHLDAADVRMPGIPLAEVGRHGDATSRHGHPVWRIPHLGVPGEIAEEVHAISLSHTVVSSGPLLEEAWVQGSRSVAAAACQAVARRWVSASGRSVSGGLLGPRGQRRVRAQDTTSCGARRRAMDVHSAHPCMLQRIIHDDGGHVQPCLQVTAAGGFSRPTERDTSCLHTL